MTLTSLESYSWPHRAASLPTERDFDPYGGDLDCQHALKIFGGMPLDQAYSVFLECPEIYQEDFMFMGPRAFAYYLPIIDRFLREVSSNCKFDDCETNILACAIEGQLDYDPLNCSEELLREVRSLTDFVQTSTSRYSGSKVIRKRIRTTWAKVADKLTKCEQDAPSYGG